MGGMASEAVIQRLHTVREAIFGLGQELLAGTHNTLGAGGALF